jgi:glycosyltransferase 2 family protein
MRTALLLALKLTVSGGLLYYLFRDQDFGSDIGPRLLRMSAHWEWVLAGLGCVGVSIYLHAWRWQALLRGQGETAPTAEIQRVNLAANFFTLSPLGATGGDAWRVIALVVGRGYGQLAVVASLVLDHMVGLASLAAVFLVFGAAFSEHWSQHSPAVRSLISGYSIFMAGGLLFMVLSALSFSPRLYAWGEQRIPFLRWPRVKAFCHACDALRQQWRLTLESTLVSVVMYLFHFFAFYCSARAVAETPPVGDVMAAMPVVDSLAGLPVSFAGLGVREKTFETLMSALSGMDEAAAVSASLAGWLMQVFWAILGGVLFLFERRSPPVPRPATV